MRGMSKSPRRRVIGLAAAFVCLAAAAFSQPVSEPLGPSSRRTPITVSEILYKPAVRTDGRNTEFIELYNSNPWPEDIGGYRLGGQVQYVFPPSTSIPAMGFVVVAAVPEDVRAVYGQGTVSGPYTNSLKTSGAVKVYDEQNALLLSVNYGDAIPWPVGADGTGHSIVLARPSYGEGDPRAWARSAVTGGSPGAGETAWTNALRNVVINEVLAHTDPPDIDSIEIYNHHTNAVNVSGCTLSDDPTENKFVIPVGTVIPARGFVSFTETQLGFGLNAAGETLYFKNADGTRMLDAVRFGPQENGVSSGRYPNGSSDWYLLSATTFGTNNAVPLVSQVGFNEIMYHPISNEDDDQYIEMFNRGTNAVSLAGWKITDGVTFTFPSNQVLAAGSHLVVARNASRLILNYPQLNLANTVGNFGGRLSHSGERIALTKPDALVGTNDAGFSVTNLVDIVVDEVAYGTGGRWGRWSDGGGSSLELIDARADKRRASNWADSDETSKAPWTTIETTGVLDNGYNTTISTVQIGLLDAGECLVDDVEVRPQTGENYVRDPGFESASASFSGNHVRSSFETNSGYPSGGRALHLRTADCLMVGPNGVTIGLANTSLSAGQTATLRFKARWLCGSREPLLRFTTCHLEATGRLPVPPNPGTPGLLNSRAVGNAGPAIYEVTHSPGVPAINQTVRVTARVSDPDGLSSVALRYRLDPQTTLTTLAMNDSGVGGDAIAKDGIYTATLPARGTTNATVFHIVATDSRGVTNRFPKLVADNAPVRECVVFFGDPNPTNLFGTYHLWLSQGNVSRWKGLPVMSNEDIDGTLVYNDRVIYNMGGRYSGSPWHQNYNGPAGSAACHYVWTMPKDDLLLGASSFNKIHWPGNDIQNDTVTYVSNDATLQREQAANLFLRGVGAPWMYRRLVAVYVNGIRRGKLMEDALRPNASTVEDEYFPGDTGAQFYKLQRWYQGGTTTSPYVECLLGKYTTTGGAFKAARYRPIYALRDSSTSMSDFTNVFALVTAANAYGRTNFTDLLENVADMENWMRVSAANQAAGNWDCFGSRSGQNADAWVSDHHPWSLFTIDFSICLDNRISGVSLFSMSDPVWQYIIATPKFRRIYCRALNDLANGILLPTRINPIMDAKYAAFTAAGLGAASPSATESWIASQRSAIVSSVSSVNAALFTANPPVATALSNAVTLTGNAPVSVVSIRVNGVDRVPLWTGVTRWSLVVPVPAGTNSLTVAACDRNGNAVGGSFVISAANAAEPEPPAGNVVFNEIMFNAPMPNAEYVELWNRATNTTYDLSGWRVDGLDYSFPPGSMLKPQSCLLLARSRVAFAATYGATIPVFDVFNGNLQSEGETLTLIQPGAAPDPDVIVDRVRYESGAPWPVAPGLVPGTSLQLVDAAQDNCRVANWRVGSTNTPGVTNSVCATLPEFPSLWLNEVQADNLTGPADSFGERDPWVELFNSGTNTIRLDEYYLGTNYNSPAQWTFPYGTTIDPGQFLVIWLDGQPEQYSVAGMHTDFRIEPGISTLALSRYVDGLPQIVDYLNFPGLPANHTYGDIPDGQPFDRRTMYNPTPAATNSTMLPPVMVSINEWMAENNGGLFNPTTGKYDDWFELHNPSTNAADLSGFFLTDTLTNRFQYTIPAGFQVPAGGFLLVWADGNTAANTNQTDLHVPFKLSKSGEAIGFFTPGGVAVDAVVFGAQTQNVSEGRFPDGAGLRLFMPVSSPRLPNLLPVASHPPVVRWMEVESGQNCVLNFQSEPGHTYRIEFKNDISEPNWRPLGANIFATDASLTVGDTPGVPQRYYRIVLVE